jgi:DNA-binding NarL/FixJ family response regulator
MSGLRSVFASADPDVINTVEDSLKNHLKIFAEEFRLTPREQEIVYLLLKHGSSTDHLAVKMNISPNTANNHLKSVFAKVDVVGRADLLALFVRGVLASTASARLFARRPRVLLVSSDEASATVLSSALTELGAYVARESDPDAVLSSLVSHPQDFVLLDAKIGRRSGIEILREIRAVNAEAPTVSLLGIDPQHTLEACLDLGAMAVYRSPIDAGRVFFDLMERFIESPFDRSRFARVTTEQGALYKTPHGTLQIGNVGLGGAFVPLSAERLGQVGFAVGQRIAGVWEIDSGVPPLEAEAEIVWVRVEGSVDKPSGMGVRFVRMSREHREILRDYVATHRIRSFVPIR